MIIDERVLVISVFGIAEGERHDDDNNRKNRKDDNRFNEEVSGDFGVGQLTGGVATDDDLGNSFKHQAHAKGHNNRRELQEDEDQGVQESEDHAK